MLKSTNPKRENLENIIGDVFKNIYVSLGTTISCICLLKCQRFASSEPFNEIDNNNNFLVDDLSVFRFD